MKSLIGGLGIRVRLSLWYGAALAIVLAAYSGGLYGLLRGTLYDELDRSLREDIEAAEEELPGLVARDKEALTAFADQERWLFEVWTSAGQRAYADPFLEASPLGSPRPACASSKAFLETTASMDGLEVRAACRQIEADGQRYILRAARSASRITKELRHLAVLIALGLPTAVLLASFMGYGLAWRALRPVKRMTEQAKRITSTRLTERLHVSNPRDELGLLAQTFNEVFARLERSFEQMRRFTADASHELRTPLAAIRALGEVALSGPVDARAHRETLASILEESDGLRALVESLLTLSRADAGQLELQRRPVNIAALAASVADQLSVLAEDKSQTLVLRGAEGCPNVLADETLVRRAVTNLVDNAIQFGPEHSTIVVSVSYDSSAVQLNVEDEGPGVPPDQQERIFERFYRVDAGRARSRGGTGLGLAIARWAIQAHGGEIGVESDGQRGSRFFIRLPGDS